MRQFNFFITALLFFTCSAHAGPFLIKPGKVKVISDFSQSKSSRVFNQDGATRDFGLTENNRHPLSKKEGLLYIEFGAWPSLNFLGYISGGRQEFFGGGDLSWLSLAAGMRIKLYEKFAVFSFENNYGYRQENIPSDINFKREEGAFINTALLMGLPWRFNRYVDGFLSSSIRWEVHFQKMEQNTLAGDAGLGINISKDFLGRRILLLGEFFANAEISGEKEYRAIEYKLQPSIVIFLSDKVGVQTGGRWQFLGKNTTRSTTGFVKIWLEF